MLIGVFDSGVGGLTVLRALRAAWPGHSTVYLGDTARVPYGSKSRDTVVRYARQNTQYLMSQGIDLLVIACNTASAYALDELRAELAIPVIGVIDPGAAAAAAALHARGRKAGGTIGVIGTRATIDSGAYERSLRLIRPDLAILTRACPMFVPLVEEGWEATAVARSVAVEYLADWAGTPPADRSTPGDAARPRPEAIILGCTHYPVLKPVLADLMGPGVDLIDSAEATSRAVAPYIESAAAEHRPRHRLIVTDGAQNFAAAAGRLLGERDVSLEVIDLTPLASPLA